MKKYKVYSTRVIPKVNRNRTEKIEIRCTKLEKERIKHNAKFLSTSEFLRTLGLKRKISPVFGEGIIPLLDQLKYANNNINQLTKLFHTNKNEMQDYEKLDQLSKDLDLLWAIYVEIRDAFFSLI